jgi:ankyrin repeat protein
MNLSEKRCSLNRVSSRNQIPIGVIGRSAVLAVAIMGWCGAIHGAEIHEAAELGDLEKVKACLEKDPKQINATDAKGRTVLASAARSGKKQLVEFLLEKGATEDIFAAAIVGQTDKVAAFLKQDPKLINARDSGGRTALHWAALYGQEKVMELLLAEKADVNSLDEDGFTPLHWAATFNQSDAVKVLLANKADTNLKVPKYGWTALRLTVIHGHMAAAEALLNGGADPNVKDEENIPLLHQAVIRGKKEMVELLLDKKADVNTKDSEGETALDEAQEQGNKEIIEILRKHGGKEKRP